MADEFDVKSGPRNGNRINKEVSSKALKSNPDSVIWLAILVPVGYLFCMVAVLDGLRLAQSLEDLRAFAFAIPIAMLVCLIFARTSGKIDNKSFLLIASVVFVTFWLNLIVLKLLKGLLE